MTSRSELNTGGPAFPTDMAHQPAAGQWHFEGMTLRDYFAARAMQAYWSDPHVAPDLITAAAWAYDMADAMLKVRNG